MSLTEVRIYALDVIQHRDTYHCPWFMLNIQNTIANDNTASFITGTIDLFFLRELIW
jgi:hypothetical protein